MLNKLVFLFLAIMICFISCKKNISIKEFDTEKWKSDKGGCSGVRKSVTDDFIKIKNQLKGHSSGEIRDFLGKPDKEDLQTRNQKYYYYYLEPGIHCSSTLEVSNSEKITVRFSAMDRVTEINYSKGG